MSQQQISVVVHNDPGCPWGYSAIPALRVLEWRYGDQLAWRLVVIGLTEDASQYAARGYTPLKSAQGWQRFRRYGMPLVLAPKASLSATAPACRAIVAARIDHPGSEWAALRALQLAQFTSPLLMQDIDGIAGVLDGVAGIDGAALAGRLGDDDVTAEYERDRAEARTAAGSPSELQGKTASTDGAVRYTAPSVIFEFGGRRLEAGGFQPVEAYDVLVANLGAGTVAREPAPAGPAPLLERFPGGLATQEVAALLAVGNESPDRAAAERALLELVAAGGARRVACGDDALWLPA